ncbi:MAG TPA: LAGLIDADG family homing endonuclease [Candidatus Nanoarchaeia archaeon]|nr:LAGLIDADG family homing endonuclease [Candidatus Nanoarchaeia archaeon]
MKTSKKEMAELCGIILGDGHLHKTCNKITITGSLDDESYHIRRVSLLFKNNFNVKPIFFKQEKKGAHYISVESKKIMEYFIKLGLIRGSKTNVSIPQIIEENNTLAVHFLRGLFDTDGCLKFSKQTRKLSYYPRIRIIGKESPMTKDLGSILTKLNFDYGLCIDKRTKNKILIYEISGKKNVQKWFNTIRPNNYTKVKKYESWLKDGFYKK